MARATEKHSDPIVRDLQAIRRLNWSRPEGFTALETLLTHPLIVHLAREPKGDQERVEALESILREVVARIEREEKKSPPAYGRSVATASTALLRLAPEFRQMSLEDIRAHITGTWEKRGGGGISVDGFRQHLEASEVYEPFAAEFRRMARDQPAGYQKMRLATVERDLSPIAGSLMEMETERHQERLAHIREGVLKIRSEDEMFRILVTLTEAAEHELQAVDHVDIAEWFSSPRLSEYLRHQLGHIRHEDDLTLERIRIVTDDELQVDGRKREQLDLLIKLHEDAQATFLLCRADSIGQLQLGFTPHIGLLLVDACANPAAVTGKLSGDGSIGRALVYLSKTDEVMQFRDEYERLRMTAVEQDRELREQLARSL